MLTFIGNMITVLFAIVLHEIYEGVDVNTYDSHMVCFEDLIRLRGELYFPITHNIPHLSQIRQIRPKFRPEFLPKSGKSGSGRIWKLQIRCTSKHILQTALES